MKKPIDKIPKELEERVIALRKEWRKLSPFANIYTEYSQKHFYVKLWLTSKEEAKEAKKAAEKFGFKAFIYSNFYVRSCKTIIKY